METRIPLLSIEEERQLFGPHDRHAKEVSRRLQVRFSSRGGDLRLSGPEDRVEEVARRVEDVLGVLRSGGELAPAELRARLLGEGPPALRRLGARDSVRGGERLHLRVRTPEARTETQQRYLDLLRSKDLVFAIGPAGTGKTFLAVAAALEEIAAGRVRRLVLTRPAVEAGERLGFLPGDLEEKVDPYLRPLYDALEDLASPSSLRRLREQDRIEVAPLAFMRGRTLNHSFVILDEAQNATPVQMKMFLTRIGEGSRAVVTGDHTQTDLPSGSAGGLEDAIARLRDAPEVGSVEFHRQDVQRSALVQRILEAYGDL